MRIDNECFQSVFSALFMITQPRYDELPDNQRVVITGLGLTAPNGNSIGEFREALLNKKSGVQEYELSLIHI